MSSMKFQKLDLDKLIQESSSDPEFVEEYNKLRRAYELQKGIIEAREKVGLNQRELAERAGMDPSDLSKIERGLVSPSVTTLDRIAKAMGRELVISFK